MPYTFSIVTNFIVLSIFFFHLFILLFSLYYKKTVISSFLEVFTLQRKNGKLKNFNSKQFRDFLLQRGWSNALEWIHMQNQYIGKIDENVQKLINRERSEIE